MTSLGRQTQNYITFELKSTGIKHWFKTVIYTNAKYCISWIVTKQMIQFQRE